MMHNSNGKSSSEVTTLVIAGLVVFALIYYLNPGIFSHASLNNLQNTSTSSKQGSMAHATTAQMISYEFGSYTADAMKIANCESSMDPAAVNTQAVDGSYATGLFQILYPSTWNSTSFKDGNPKDAWTNTQAAYEIFHRDGNNWHEWACAKIVGVQ
jgi:hypothetical protein